MNSYFLIWRRENLEDNLEAASKINNLGDLPLTSALQDWAIKFQLSYPNNSGTKQWTEPFVCANPNSLYYNAVAIAMSETLYKNLNQQIINDLVLIGIPLPNEGVSFPVEKLPDDWYLPIAPIKGD